MHDVPHGCVVVGVDGSADSDRAVGWAAAQAALEDRTLAIVHSTSGSALRDTVWLDAQGIDHRELSAALDEAARDTVTSARMLATAAAPRIEVVTAVVEPDPRLALVELSQRAHLVVVGSRGRGPVRTALLGSVSASVARQAHCPVVVCRPSARPVVGPGILVGSDGDPAAAPVLEFAFAQASLRGAPLTVMHCFWDVAVAVRGPGIVDDTDPDDLSDLRLLLTRSVSALVEKFPDVDVTLQLARGLVDECLVDRLPDSSLVVVGRSQASGWARFLHASCAIAVLERAHTTVAVVPESA
jgi:nucleotide-binding universal stress UspA family protein